MTHRHWLMPVTWLISCTFHRQGTVEEYNQAVDKALEAWKTWREVITCKGTS